MAEFSTPDAIARSLFPEIWESTPGPLIPQLSTPVPGRAVHIGDTSSNQPPRPPTPTATTSQGNSSEPCRDKFAEWLTSKGVNDGNVERLISNGFNSQHTFALLKPQDVSDIGVTPLGQVRLVEHLISPSATSQSNTSDSSPGPVGSIAQLPQTDRHQAEAGDYLLSFPKTTRHLAVTDHLPSPPPSERVLFSDGDERVVLHSGVGKPRLESTTPLQWMRASIKIMRELVARGDLALHDINAYLNYMEKIAELATKYTWQSLLVYDREYRKWQAQTRCKWGQDNIHLVEVYLETRPRQPPQRNAPRPANSRPMRTDEICRLFNAGRCHWGTACKFAHRCSVPGCEGSHSWQQHPQTSEGTSKNGPARR